MRKILLLLIFLFPIIGYSGGNLQLNGVLRNFNSQTIEVEDTGKVYTIIRKKLTGPQTAKLVNLKSGAEMNLSVPFDALTQVRKKN